jgi:hypothetical protein
MLLFSENEIPESYRSAKKSSQLDLSSYLKNNDSSSSIFKHSGARVWLSGCDYTVNSFPETLAEFKGKFGEFTKWEGDFHPYSMAKQRPRRIYRQSTPPVSVAETLGDACEVRETEIVLQDAEGITTYGVYDSNGNRIEFSEFPVANGTNSIRATPDTCLGCHLKLDTRKFNVRIPSAVALGLGPMDNHKNRVTQNPKDCRNPRDIVVQHL